jgi:adenosylcobinamide-GDP ribazoletransferase
MQHLIAAIQFITVIPFGRRGPFEPLKLTPYFPVVGLILGCITAGFDLAARHFWSDPIVALLDVILLTAMTGAFHLDGLGDTADGLYGNRTPGQALAIMKDSRIGTMGLVAIVFVLAAKWTALAELNSHRSLLIVIVPAYARGSMLFGIYFLPYGRPEGGTGRAFFDQPMHPAAFRMFLIPLGLSFFIGPAAILLNLFFIALVAGILTYYKHKLNAITGDMLGAMTEITEAALFVLLSLKGLA